MADLISRSAAIKVIEKWFDKIELNPDILIDGIITIPAVDAEPIKHGRWINDKGLYKCSVCNNFTITGWDIPIEQMNKTMKYCNNCGARMDEVKE